VAVVEQVVAVPQAGNLMNYCTVDTDTYTVYFHIVIYHIDPYMV
ncbi:hypothetical protein THOM_1218, partial [Trachipleistophora hominis]